jgi:hypothetical protein
LAAGLGSIILVRVAFTIGAVAQTSDSSYFSDLRWRLVGPHRAGRIWCLTGVFGDPTTCYAGTPAGALWKSTNGGTTWASISDRLPTTGIGAVAVAASNPNALYVGTGNDILGSGVYRSDDAGSTWCPAGLVETRYITGAGVRAGILEGNESPAVRPGRTRPARRSRYGSSRRYARKVKMIPTTSRRPSRTMKVAALVLAAPR